jgi:hypothetical protein
LDLDVRFAPKADISASFDQLVGQRAELAGNDDVQCLWSLKLCWLLDRKIGGLGTV